MLVGLFMLRHQGALGRAVHLLLLQAQILCQRGQFLLQYRRQHGPALALLVQQAQSRTLLRGRGLLGPGLLGYPWVKWGVTNGEWATSGF